MEIPRSGETTTSATITEKILEKLVLNAFISEQGDDAVAAKSHLSENLRKNCTGIEQELLRIEILRKKIAEAHLKNKGTQGDDEQFSRASKRLRLEIDSFIKTIMQAVRNLGSKRYEEYGNKPHTATELNEIKVQIKGLVDAISVMYTLFNNKLKLPNEENTSSTSEPILKTLEQDDHFADVFYNYEIFKDPTGIEGTMVRLAEKMLDIYMKKTRGQKSGTTMMPPISDEIAPNLEHSESILQSIVRPIDTPSASKRGPLTKTIGFGDSVTAEEGTSFGIRKVLEDVEISDDDMQPIHTGEEDTTDVRLTLTDAGEERAKAELIIKEINQGNSSSVKPGEKTFNGPYFVSQNYSGPDTPTQPAPARKEGKLKTTQIGLGAVSIPKSNSKGFLEDEEKTTEILRPKLLIDKNEQSQNILANAFRMAEEELAKIEATPESNLPRFENGDENGEKQDDGAKGEAEPSPGIRPRSSYPEIKITESNFYKKSGQSAKESGQLAGEGELPPPRKFVWHTKGGSVVPDNDGEKVDDKKADDNQVVTNITGAEALNKDTVFDKEADTDRQVRISSTPQNTVSCEESLAPKKAGPETPKPTLVDANIPTVPVGPLIIANNGNSLTESTESEKEEKADQEATTKIMPRSIPPEPPKLTLKDRLAIHAMNPTKNSARKQKAAKWGALVAGIGAVIAAGYAFSGSGSKQQAETSSVKSTASTETPASGSQKAATPTSSAALESIPFEGPTMEEKIERGVYKINAGSQPFSDYLHRIKSATRLTQEVKKAAIAVSGRYSSSSKDTNADLSNNPTSTEIQTYLMSSFIKQLGNQVKDHAWMTRYVAQMRHDFAQFNEKGEWSKGAEARGFKDLYDSMVAPLKVEVEKQNIRFTVDTDRSTNPQFYRFVKTAPTFHLALLYAAKKMKEDPTNLAKFDNPQEVKQKMGEYIYNMAKDTNEPRVQSGLLFMHRRVFGNGNRLYDDMFVKTMKVDLTTIKEENAPQDTDQNTPVVPINYQPQKPTYNLNKPAYRRLPDGSIERTAPSKYDIKAPVYTKYDRPVRQNKVSAPVQPSTEKQFATAEHYLSAFQYGEKVKADRLAARIKAEKAAKTASYSAPVNPQPIQNVTYNQPQHVQPAVEVAQKKGFLSRAVNKVKSWISKPQKHYAIDNSPEAIAAAAARVNPNSLPKRGWKETLKQYILG